MDEHAAKALKSWPHRKPAFAPHTDAVEDMAMHREIVAYGEAAGRKRFA